MFHFPVPLSGYVRKTERQFSEISHFIRSLEPDLVGLVEVDGGSVRTPRINQAQRLADEMEHFCVFEHKYAVAGFSRYMPIMRKQGNAFLAREEMVNNQCHYFRSGIKRLVLEIEMEEFVIMLVHLSIQYRHRQCQLRMLADLVSRCHKPVVVAGDFNIFRGQSELEAFYAATRLKNANTDHIATYPSARPKWEIDLILHSPHITVQSVVVPRVVFSDHLPIVCDFIVSP